MLGDSGLLFHNPFIYFFFILVIFCFLRGEKSWLTGKERAREFLVKAKRQRYELLRSHTFNMSSLLQVYRVTPEPVDL